MSWFPAQFFWDFWKAEYLTYVLTRIKKNYFSHYWLGISKAEGFVPPPSVYEKFLYLLIVRSTMICYCTIWPARGCISQVYFQMVFFSYVSKLHISATFLSCISQLYFSIVFRNLYLLIVCGAMICYCTIWPARGCISQVYFQTVFFSYFCISQLHSSAVFLSCISKLYFQFCTYW